MTSQTPAQLEHVPLRWPVLHVQKTIGIALVFLLFAVVYGRSLTFVYIEGDDATSIAYHALGRNPELQPPYSAYQSMMDGLLALLPADEKLVRVLALCIISLGPPLVAIFIALLAFEWAPELIRIRFWITALLVPLLVPELFYLGLVYTPAVVALAAVLGAHLWLRHSLIRTKAKRLALLGDPGFLLSAVLFGVGAACRWDVLAYGGLVVIDAWLGIGLLRQKSKLSKPERFSAACFWGVLALASWLATVTLNGYSPSTILRTLRESGPVQQYPELAVTVATIQPFATPALVLFALIGCFLLLKRKHPLPLLVALSLILVLRFLPFGVPKWIIIAVPGITVCALAGFSAVWTSAMRPQARYAVRTAMFLLVLAPWLVGLHASYGDSAYGPGFEVKPFDHPLTAKQRPTLAFGPGALVPTSEGPRPVGGHAWVLLGGAWRKIAQEGADQVSAAIQEAIARDLPLLQDEQQGFAVAALTGMQFTTHDPWNRTVGPDFLIERKFVSRDGKRQVRVLELKDKQKLLTAADERLLQTLAGTDQLVIYAYTSTLRRCYRLAPDSLERVGAGTNAAVLHLDRLHAPDPHGAS